MHVHIQMSVCIYPDPASTRFAVILLGCSCLLPQSIFLNDMGLIMDVVSV